MENATRPEQLSGTQFLQNLNDSGLFTLEELGGLPVPGGNTVDASAAEVARQFMDAGKLTEFQAEAVRKRDFSELVVGNYEVLARLGAGGMGTVFKARHRRMKRVVALKVLSRAACQAPTFLQRFQREVEVIARLNHPNIVMAFDADEAELGHFLVMEFVDGRDLASEVMKRGPLPVAEAVHAITQAARALEYAHSQGIIHRDIKPANLLRDTNGVVKVADLGLARCNEVFSTADKTCLTQAGGIVGTVDFMPPEQATDSTKIDCRADIYSLGCTFYFLLTGVPPYRGESIIAILLKHRGGDIPSLHRTRTDVSASVEAIFRKAVATNPEGRYQTMTELLRALEALGPALSSAHGGPTPGTGPVLLVEPSRTQANIIRHFLAELGTTDTLVVPSGQKALEAMRASKPRAVVSSMHLDDMTGAQLLEKIRAEQGFADVGFVLITASTADALPGLHGVARSALLAKPFDRDGLGKALTSATAG